MFLSSHSSYQQQTFSRIKKKKSSLKRERRSEHSCPSSFSFSAFPCVLPHLEFKTINLEVFEASKSGQFGNCITSNPIILDSTTNNWNSTPLHFEQTYKIVLFEQNGAFLLKLCKLAINDWGASFRTGRRNSSQQTSIVSPISFDFFFFFSE